jgi:hypothetical protein
MYFPLQLIQKLWARGAAPTIILSTLAACTVTGGGGASEGIGFRQARFAEVSAVREYRSCQEEAFAIDDQARKSASPAKYLASARLIEKCEAAIGQDIQHVGVDVRMQSYAVAILNRFKGGDIAAARANLLTFKTTFEGRDLYLEDGSSFIETLEVLLGINDRRAVADLSLVNVNSTIRAELRRANYWINN